MEIDQMEAGKELDALIAEQVFRMVWCRLNRSDTTAILRWPDSTRNYWPSQPTDRRILLSADSYSTDIEDTWKVTRKLNADGFLFELFTQPDGDSAARFFRERNRKDMPKHGWWATASTAPLAICRAALKAQESAK